MLGASAHPAVVGWRQPSPIRACARADLSGSTRPRAMTSADGAALLRHDRLGPDAMGGVPLGDTRRPTRECGFMPPGGTLGGSRPGPEPRARSRCLKAAGGRRALTAAASCVAAPAVRPRDRPGRLGEASMVVTVGRRRRRRRDHTVGSGVQWAAGRCRISAAKLWGRDGSTRSHAVPAVPSTASPRSMAIVMAGRRTVPAP